MIAFIGEFNAVSLGRTVADALVWEPYFGKTIVDSFWVLKLLILKMIK